MSATPAATGDATVALQGALAAEHTAVWAYAVIAADLSARSAARALDVLAGHRRRRDVVAALLDSRGVAPVAAEPAYALPEGAPAVVAAGIEDGVAAAYAYVLATAADGAVVTIAATALRDAAVTSARWSGTTISFPGLPGRG